MKYRNCINVCCLFSDLCVPLSDSMTSGQDKCVSLTTVRGVFVLKAVEAGDMAELIEMYLEGLRERSVYAVALQDVNRHGMSRTRLFIAEALLFRK